MLKSYVIHLSASTKRDELVAKLLGTLPGGEILEAVDGRAMTNAGRAQVTTNNLLSPNYPFGLMPSEIGCFISHRKAWQKIADGDAPFGFVAEDDVVLRPGFEKAMALALRNANEETLIRFPIRQREKPSNITEQAGDLQLFRPVTIGLTAALYLLGRNAARHLVEKSVQFDRPVDTWLQMRWHTGVDSQTLWPSHISSAAASHGGSTIQEKRTKLQQFKRTWQRARYRATIISLSKQS